MAEVTSLGLHVPSALQYLIAEGALPREPNSTLYTWKSYCVHGTESEEELLWTKRHVVYSKNGYVRRIFNFQEKDDSVDFAVLTSFDSSAHGIDTSIGVAEAEDGTGGAQPAADVSAFGKGKARRKSGRSSIGVTLPTLQGEVGTVRDGPSKSRALVILVGNQCHIHYLAGSSHILSIPFAVAEVFPSKDGIILQRNTTPRPRSAGDVPAAPPNSFFSSQSLFSPQKRSPLGPGKDGKDLMTFPPWDSPSKRYSLSSATAGPGDDPSDNDLPHFWTLTDPLSDFAAIAAATVGPVPRHLRTNDVNIFVEYVDLDASETLLYVSPDDELITGPSAGNVALMFFVTMNDDLDQITIWQGWYLRPRSLSALTAMRKAVQQLRERRRSSMMNTLAAATGRTPAVRFHDKGRESFAATAELPRKKAKSKRKGSQSASKAAADEEADMALRMDPDFLLGQQPLKSSRQAGSLMSRGDLAVTDPMRAHTTGGVSHAMSARRGTSIGISQDRRSFGTSIYRKSRGSVPGSTFSKSLGPDDEDSMDIEDDSFREDELEAEVARVTQLFLATSDFASVESTFTFGVEGAKPELILRKAHVLPLSTQRYSIQKMAVKDRFKVCTLPHQASQGVSAPVVTVCIHDKVLHRTLNANFDVVRAPISDELAENKSSTPSMAVPLFRSQETQNSVFDITRVGDEGHNAIVSSMGKSQLEICPDDGLPWTLRLPPSLQLHDTADVRTDLGSSFREVGLNRTIDLADPTLALHASGKAKHIKVSDQAGHTFEIRLRLRPRNAFIDMALRVVKAVLSGIARRSVMMLWASAATHLKQQNLSSTDANVLELEAFIMVIISFAVGSLGQSKGTPRESLSNQASTFGKLLPRSETELERVTAKLGPSWQCMALKNDVNVGSRGKPQHARSSSPGVMKSSSYTLSMTDIEAKTRSLLHHLSSNGSAWLMEPAEAAERARTSTKLLLAIQLLREECKLSSSADPSTLEICRNLAACLAQLGHYLQLDQWDWKSGTPLSADFAHTNFDFSESTIADAHKSTKPRVPGPFSVNHWLESAVVHGFYETPLDLDAIAAFGSQQSPLLRQSQEAKSLLPRLTMLIALLSRLSKGDRGAESTVEIMAKIGITESFIATLPESTAGYLREYIVNCQSSPPSIWPRSLLRLVDREDLSPVTSTASTLVRSPAHLRHVQNTAADLQMILGSAERLFPTSRSHEADRHAIIAQIFSEDRRFVDAARLTNSAILQVAECSPQPGNSDEDHLEQQRRVMQWVITRTVALPAGGAMVHFESQKPLISEKFQVAGFSTICQMKPTDNTVSADKTGFTEEKLSWAFFHAGASAGLHISRKAAGIDTSWIVFNKPEELTNRHAGFLLALGLNGHLRNMAKWLAFKYLTPKHTMTSIGLLLGLSASYMGTMDSLITRMLSVHITRMLPPGAAELNVSPLTQTVGLLGVGLLYYNTQHRRTSEMMLSELEHRDIEAAGSAADSLRDESYRLAAGFSLGLMNLGKGNNLQGLQGMGLLQRLLSIAIGPRPVDLVHVVDKATAGATLALAFIYMKTNDATVARKIDVPDTLSQIDHVRPDILLLRTLAKNLIMWDSIQATEGWIRSQLPTYAAHYFAPKTKALLPVLPLRSSEIPLFNIVTGHAWSLALRHAGTASESARDEILHYLDVFWATVQQSGAEATYYDAQLARTTVRRCVDLLALAAATVMAGTGDVKTFRYLRRLHGRTDADTTYGSHMAAHLAVGSLFLGGGTYTFATSDIAVAGLVMAFYPLWPREVLDNAVHLQAFRHLWVLAAEARCVVCLDVDSGRPVQMDVKVRMRDGSETIRRSPCLLPELKEVSSVETMDNSWWKARMDFQRNEAHVKAFMDGQTLWVRRAPAKEEIPGLFGRTLKGLNEQENMPEWWRMWAELLRLPALESIEENELGLAIPSNAASGVHEDEKGTVMDDRLVLLSDAKSWEVGKLWNVRLLLRWAEKRRLEPDSRMKWLGDEFIQRLESVMQRRMAEMHIEARMQ